MNLLDYRKTKYSGIGNDGIIERIFKTLDIKNGLFVEFGAWDGLVECNCKKLFEEGWSGIFIEADSSRFLDLLNNYGDEDRITCINSMIGIDDNKFDDVVGEAVGGREIDFCSIDINGLDVEIFETIEKHLPKVICTEGGQMLHPYGERVKPKIAKHNIQQSLLTMTKIYEAKGYKALCSYQDTFFIKKEYYDKFDVSDSVMVLYLEGLKALARRMPWVQNTLRGRDLKNSIIDAVLNECGYADYGWKGRKAWAVECKDKIDEFINERIELEKNMIFIRESIRDVAKENREGVFAQMVQERPELEALIEHYRKEIEGEL